MNPTPPRPRRLSLRNLTPHPIVLFDTDGVPVTLAPQGPVPRVTLTRWTLPPIETVHGRLARSRTARGTTVSDLPGPRPGVLLVVSRLVAETAAQRTDLVFPDDAVRDRQGRVVGARTLGVQNSAGTPTSARLRRLGHRRSRPLRRGIPRRRPGLRN